ncbi:hypothetical protein G9455_13800 [Aeromonas hydrophila]|uniref:DUF6630 family protein n=1 Tax=Aeromonas hydrophila TaxID=644 RepID=UPI000588B5A5|nr:hypothetical protein [Aeromonas hydrophila]AJE36738.1 hypothetical protein V469_13180 [Aeromonas hydrophila J-1]AKJ34997.1 hypothetical protein U876_13590 [Aeromonas hydrophila NJ-35]ALQ63837.1 hypothetical protein AS145_13445 [Aeromonas hydrophila]ALZ80511.1 hypothetical protein AhyD4_13255 [Aeromonas hydrophila]AXV30417.1 hypothetical protein BFW97_13345 [Aeromonas hydrophila]
MKAIKKLFLLLSVIILSPLLIPMVYVERRRKKWLLSILLSPLPEEIRVGRLNALMNTHTDELQGGIVSALVEFNSDEHWACLNIDWRDVEEVELQGNALADIHGIKEHFMFSEPGEDTSVWRMLVLYDLWLQARGYEVVLWDIDVDQYTGFICRTDVLDKLLNEGRKLGLAMVKLDHVNEQ